MDPLRPWLLIPIETKVREFEAKLLLSVYGVLNGFNVILGEQVELKRHLRNLPRGILIEKSITPYQINGLKRSKSLGNKLVAWCEEGLVYRNSEIYKQIRISEESMSLVDIFFCWGNKQSKDIIEKLPHVTNKLNLSGNPRFDLLRPEFRTLFSDRSKELKNKHGRFILIPSNFALINHFRGADFVKSLQTVRGHRSNKESLEYIEGWKDHLYKIFESFLDLVPAIASNFFDHEIIVRPQPSENYDSWRSAISGLENVSVINEGNIIPWIMASEVVIHNSCTTGVETYLLDKPVIAYCPYSSDIYDSKLPNALSLQVYTISELINSIRSILENGNSWKNQFGVDSTRRELARQYIMGIDNETSCERIIKAIKILNCMPDKFSNSMFNRILIKTINAVYPVKMLAARLMGHVVAGDQYITHKFPGLSIEEIRDSVSGIENVLEQKNTVAVDRIDGLKNVYKITAV